MRTKKKTVEQEKNRNSQKSDLQDKKYFPDGYKLLIRCLTERLSALIYRLRAKNLITPSTIFSPS